VTANEDLFSGDVGRSIFADYQYNKVTIHLLTKRRFENDLSTISIRAQEWTPSPSDIEAMVARRVKELRQTAPSAGEASMYKPKQKSRPNWLAKSFSVLCRNCWSGLALHGC